MGKIISKKETVRNLIISYPEIKDIMLELGFKDIVKPGMLETAGRFMTLEKGTALKKIDINTMIETFRKKDFDLVD